MGGVAAAGDSPSLKPGGRYPGTGVRAACLRQLGGMIFFAGSMAAAAMGAGSWSGDRAARVWRAGPAAGVPGGGGFSPRGFRLAGDAGSPAGV